MISNAPLACVDATTLERSPTTTTFALIWRRALLAS
jgi:hypothetical protein